MGCPWLACVWCIRGGTAERAILLSVMNLSPSQVRLPNDWDKAFYNPDVLQCLGFPRDHNTRVAKALGIREPM
jgi:hypothetical protein